MFVVYLFLVKISLLWFQNYLEILQAIWDPTCVHSVGCVFWSNLPWCIKLYRPLALSHFYFWLFSPWVIKLYSAIVL